MTNIIKQFTSKRGAVYALHDRESYVKNKKYFKVMRNDSVYFKSTSVVTASRVFDELATRLSGVK